MCHLKETLKEKEQFYVFFSPEFCVVTSKIFGWKYCQILIASVACKSANDYALGTGN